METDETPSIVASDAASSVVVSERNGDIVSGRDPDQFSERRRQPDRREGYFDLDRAKLSIDDPHRVKLLEEIHHLLVAGQHQCPEAGDALLARASAGHFEQYRDPFPASRRSL